MDIELLRKLAADAPTKPTKPSNKLRKANLDLAFSEIDSDIANKRQKLISDNPRDYKEYMAAQARQQRAEAIGSLSGSLLGAVMTPADSSGVRTFSNAYAGGAIGRGIGSLTHTNMVNNDYTAGTDNIHSELVSRSNAAKAKNISDHAKAKAEYKINKIKYKADKKAFKKESSDMEDGYWEGIMKAAAQAPVKPVSKVSIVKAENPDAKEEAKSIRAQRISESRERNPEGYKNFHKGALIGKGVGLLGGGLVGMGIGNHFGKRIGGGSYAVDVRNANSNVKRDTKSAKSKNKARVARAKAEYKTEMAEYKAARKKYKTLEKKSYDFEANYDAAFADEMQKIAEYDMTFNRIDGSRGKNKRHYKSKYMSLKESITNDVMSDLDNGRGNGAEISARYNPEYAKLDSAYHNALAGLKKHSSLQKIAETYDTSGADAVMYERRADADGVHRMYTAEGSVAPKFKPIVNNAYLNSALNKQAEMNPMALNALIGAGGIGLGVAGAAGVDKAKKEIEKKKYLQQMALRAR